MTKQKHIVFTGPESSGKTTLAEAFAKNKGACIVTEYARDYLANKSDYIKSDLLEIAKGQQANIDLALKKNDLSQKENNIVICDTDLLTIKIWSEYKYGTCDDWIIKTLANKLPDLYVLCKPDFPWEEDPLRENPNDREELYEIYLAEIKKLKVPFIEVGGSAKERLESLTELFR